MGTPIEDFFEDVLGVEGYKLLWLLNSQNGRKRSFWYETAAELAAQVPPLESTQFHVYFGMGSRQRELGPELRGERKDYSEYRALWLDVDVLGPNHKSDRLPPDNFAALELIARLPLEPTYVVASGGGLQAYWVLTEAVSAAEMEQVLPAWASSWRLWGDERGWHVDNVFDLGRVMRAPGSINQKNQARVEIIAADRSKTYDLSDFDAYLAAPEPIQVVAPRDPTAPERPGDAYNRLHAGDAVAHAVEILEKYGFVAERRRHNGEIPYVRPGKDARDGFSAMVYPDGHVTVYSSEPSLPTTMANKVAKPLDPFGLYTMFVHNGDWAAATEQLRQEGLGDPTLDDSWVFADKEELQRYQESPGLPSAPEEAKAALDAALDPAKVEQADAAQSRWEVWNLFDLADAPEEDPPSVGFRDDDVCLLYEGKVHTVNGEPGGMKSWFTQVIGKQTIEVGDRALWIDFENSKRSIYDRFRFLGVSGDDLRRIHVTTPDAPFGPAERKAIESLCAEFAFKLIVVDGTTDAFSTFGLDVNSSTDVAKFDKGFLKVLAATGAAVVYVDHVTKDKETRGSWGFGSQHKKSAIDGASFGVESVSSFGKGMHGRAKIYIHKDKPGDLLQHALEGVHTPICELDMISDPETHSIRAEIKAPSVEMNPNFRPTGIMERIADYVKAHPGLSKDVITTGAGLNGAKKEWVSLGFQLLESEGYIASDLGHPKDKRWRPVKDYSEAQDFLDHQNPLAPNPEADAAMGRLRRRLAGELDGSAPVAPLPPLNEDGMPEAAEPLPEGVSVEDLI